MQDHVESHGSSSSPSQKYTIKSHFGHARRPRSRKSRPCDACRQRKIACVIATQPPCLSCQRKGLECKASFSATHDSRLPLREGHNGDPDATTDQAPLADAAGLPSIADSLGGRDVVNSPRSTLSGYLHNTRAIGVPQVGQSSPANSSLLAHYSPAATDQSTVAQHEAAQSLDSVANKTAHFMGLSAEQDTFLVDGFRSFIASENDEIDAKIRQVYRGDIHAGDTPVHFMIIEDEFPDYNNAARKDASGGLENIVAPFSDNLIRLYFRHVHPAYPIIFKASFLGQYAGDKTSIPASLRGAVYALASAFWHKDPSLPRPCPFPQHVLVDHAHNSLRRELEAPKLMKLQACLLLLHIRPPYMDSVETPETWIQAAQATACAQMMGLHQDPTLWSIPQPEKQRRKRLWWAVYTTDCWSAVCHGNPPHISQRSFNIPPACMEDVRVDEDVPQDLWYLVDAADRGFQVADGVRFLETVKIALHLRKILDCSFQTGNTSNDPERAVSAREQLIEIRQTFEYWASVAPGCVQVGQRSQHSDADHNIPLHLCFYAAEVLLFRALMHPATRTARAAPDSNLRRWFPIALADFQTFTAFVENISIQDLQGFWIRHARTQLILCGNFYIYLFLLAWTPNDVEVAYGLLERFHQALQRFDQQLQSTADHAPDAILLIRPVKLRIQSFFTHAAELIKRGGPG